MNYKLFTIVILCLGLIFGCGGDSWTKKGKAFLAAEDYNSAIWYFQQAIKNRPTNAEAHYQLGLAYYRLGRNDKAMESFRIAAKLAPKRMDVQLALGEAYMKMGQRRLAKRIFLKVLENSKSAHLLQKIASLTGDVYKTIRLTPDYVRVYGASASAGKIAFTAYVDDNNEIYIMDIDGKNKNRLTFNDTNDYSPSLSNDGTKIAYVSFMRWRNSNDEIFLMDINGKNKNRLTFNIYTDGDPTFSADGRLIAFESNRDGNSEIYIMDVDGKNQRRLTFTSTKNYSPSFSPDGSQVAFAAYSIVEGSEKSQSSISSDLLKRSRFVAADLYGVVSQICVIDIDGKNLRQLTDVKAINANPSFSPDGKRIVFDSNRDGDSEIYIMDIDGKNQMQLTNNEYIDMQPTFAPDGKRIIFTGERMGSKNLGIYVMNLEQTFTKTELVERLEELKIQKAGKPENREAGR